MDRELIAILVLPFITIMAVMIAVFCRLRKIVFSWAAEVVSDIFERKKGGLPRILSVNQDHRAYRQDPPPSFSLQLICEQ